jgi:hypothetical protein
LIDWADQASSPFQLADGNVGGAPARVFEGPGAATTSMVWAPDAATVVSLSTIRGGEFGVRSLAPTLTVNPAGLPEIDAPDGYGVIYEGPASPLLATAELADVEADGWALAAEAPSYPGDGRDGIGADAPELAWELEIEVRHLDVDPDLAAVASALRHSNTCGAAEVRGTHAILEQSNGTTRLGWQLRPGVHVSLAQRWLGPVFLPLYQPLPCDAGGTVGDDGLPGYEDDGSGSQRPDLRALADSLMPASRAEWEAWLVEDGVTPP